MNAKTQLNLFGQVSELTLSYSPKTRPSERKEVSSSRDAHVLFMENWEGIEHHESFKVLTLNKANKVLGMAVISIGGVDSTVVDPKIIMQYALLCNASSIILAHNHPSGKLFPSDSDIRLTEKIKRAAEVLDMKCLDHLIICSEDRYYSFADEGKL